MRPNDYVTAHNISVAEFADAIGVSYEAARRYLKGERVPRRKTMRKILDFTKGAVTPNDFHQIQINRPT